MFTDLRNGTAPLSKNGTFSTTLFTQAAIDGIVGTPMSQPFFVYLAYQAVHTPLQAPADALERCAAIKNLARRTYCAMMMGVDDGVGEVMRQVQAVGRANSTITFLTTDNGGTALGAGSNTPLRCAYS
jgi:arylsulfatase A-like enzyme